MKIVIIGAGIGGLGVYLFLQKHLSRLHLSKLSLEVIEVVIYETYNAVKREAHAKNTAEDEALEGFVTDAVGGALGVGPNGMRVLRDLDEGLFQEVADQGYPVSHFHIQNAYGWSLANFPATDKANPPLHTILISRQALWHSLRERVPDHAIIRKTVSGVTCGNHRPRISFTDGSPEAEADLIIGADGVRSVAKKAILGGSSEKVDYAAIYEGLVGVGGFIKSCRLPEGDPFGRVTMTFGSQGFFAYGATSQSKPSNSAKVSPQPGAEAVWWSTYSIEPPPDTRNFDKEDARRQLENRHSNWKDPVIRSIVADANIDSVYPTWTTPNLPSWGRNGVVLIGDAAHALQPSSGQGASQALEDAQAFCILLSHYIGKSASQDEGIDATIRTYYTLRQPRVKRIADSAKYRGDMKRKKSFVGEWITYLFIWLLSKLPLDNFDQDVFEYQNALEVENFIKKQDKSAS